MHISQASISAQEGLQLPPRDSIEMEKFFLEQAARQAALDAQTRTLMLPRDQKITFSEFVALTVFEDVSNATERFNISKKGLHSASDGRPLLGKFSTEVANLVEQSESQDPQMLEYQKRISAAIYSYFVNAASYGTTSSSKYKIVATEFSGDSDISRAIESIANCCRDAGRFIAAIRRHSGKVFFSPSGITLVQDKDTTKLDFNTFNFSKNGSREIASFLKEWKKFNPRPKISNLFAHGTPYCEVPMAKDAYFANLLEKHLREKFSILPDSRLAPVELIARRIEDAFEIPTCTKALSTGGVKDYFPPFDVRDLEAVEKFLAKSSVLVGLHDKVYKVDPIENFSGSEIELREIMQQRLYDFTFERLGKGVIGRNHKSVFMGVLVNPARHLNQIPVDYRKASRPMGFTTVTLAALQSPDRDYYDVVFLEMTQTSNVTLQLDRAKFQSSWRSAIDRTTLLVQEKLKLPSHKSFSAILDILMGRVMLDVQKAINDGLPIKYTPEQREWILENINVAFDESGRPMKALKK